MSMDTVRKDIIRSLQKEVLGMQRGHRPGDGSVTTALGPVELAFPGKTFPTGAVHEFVSHTRENAVATNGFIAGVAGKLLQQGMIVWVSTARTVFPPALGMFGIPPERVIFIDTAKQRDALWAIEEALKCSALSAVAGELGELTFIQSRRLQLAVEESSVTGFIHRVNPRSSNVTACVSRWRISSLPAALPGDMPGVGYPRWHVALDKVRNGKPGTWDIEWVDGAFRYLTGPLFSISRASQRKAG